MSSSVESEAVGSLMGLDGNMFPCKLWDVCIMVWSTDVKTPSWGLGMCGLSLNLYNRRRPLTLIMCSCLERCIADLLGEVLWRGRVVSTVRDTWGDTYDLGRCVWACDWCPGWGVAVWGEAVGTLTMKNFRKLSFCFSEIALSCFFRTSIASLTDRSQANCT